MSSPALHVSTAAYPPITRVSDPRLPLQRDAHLRAWAFALLLYLVAMMWLMAGGGDLMMADRLYAFEGDAWHWRTHWLTAQWIHEGGKRLSWLLWLGTAVFTARVWSRSGWRAWRRPLLVLLFSVLLATSLVAAIKQAVPMNCPWDLQRYGGTAKLVGLFQAWPAGASRNACFPAAHASAGFAWIALYFFFLQVRPRWRGWGLGVGLAMGAVFAIAQELRGAHFVSHDLTTIMICWSVSLLLYAAFKRSARA